MNPYPAATAWLPRAEEDMRLFGPQVEGFALWPVVRCRAWQLVSNVIPDPLHAGRLRRLWRRPAELGRPAYALASLWQRRRIHGRRVDYVFLSEEAYRSVKREDGWWDVYLDDVANHPKIAGRVLRCERRAFLLSPMLVPAPRHLFTDAQLIDQMWGAWRKSDAEALQQGRQLGEIFLERMANLDRPLGPGQSAHFLDYCQAQACAFRRALHWYRRLLSPLAARALVLVNAYNHHGAVAAAKALGLRVLELQHGTISPDHPGYAWPVQARELRARLPIPDHIGSYGDFWSDVLKREGFWRDDEVTSVGSVRMDWVRRQAVRRHGRPEALRILYTSQQPTRSLAISLLGEFVRRAEQSGFPFRLIIKVHRIERPYVSEYRRLARQSPHVTVLSPYQGDTLTLIAESDVHASGWSTCHFEAVGLGVPTVVLTFPGPDVSTMLQSFSGVYQAGDGADLLNVLERIRRDAPAAEPSFAFEAERLFKPGAVASAVALLE